MYKKGLHPQPVFLIAGAKVRIKKFPTQEKNGLGISLGKWE